MYCTGNLERFGVKPIKMLDFRDKAKTEAPAAPATDAPAAEPPAK
jgi:hypothetical protein